MANVSFKRGLQSKLSTVTVTDGTFYLTTDTHRLYVGQGNQMVPVNEGVTTVANVAALQNIIQDSETNAGLAGSFYYATAENILCVWNGKKWVQINPDTNTYVEDADWVLANKSIKLALKRNDSNNTINTPNITFSGNNVTVSKDATTKDITVDIDVPDLGVTWTAADGSDREKLAVDLGDGGFSLIGGQNIALTKSQEGNNVTISAADMRPTGATISAKANSADGYNVVVNMPNSSTTAATTFDPKVKTDSSSTNYLHFRGDILDLSGTYYTQAEVDKKIQDFNAVEYKGVWPPTGQTNWASTDPYPTANVKNGSMYLVRLENAPALSSGGETPKVGDLIIAQGTEGTNGYLTNITWVRIPSGDEAQVDTTYSFAMDGESSSVGVNVSSTAGGSTNAIEMFKIKEGNKIDVTRASNSKEIVVSHESTTFTPSTPSYAINSNGKVSVLTGISKDDYGHISGTSTVAMPAPVELNTLTSSASVTNNVATITTSLTQKYIDNSSTYGTAKTATVSLAGQGLDVSASGNTVTFSLTWGEF